MVGDGSEERFAALGRVFPSPQRGALQSFEHTVDGLDLPPLASGMIPFFGRGRRLSVAAAALVGAVLL